MEKSKKKENQQNKIFEYFNFFIFFFLSFLTLAKKVFKKEIIKRFSSGYTPSIDYLIYETKRGLYACPTYYKLINADVNGAINIIRKIEPRAFVRVPINDLVIAPKTMRLEYSKKGYSKGKSGLHTAGRPIYHKSKHSPQV